ncbi:restriction endonuclease subunit S [Corynebacterium lizhenjunii]|uniref:Restriction endonuclease subunit S n=1 Tax=Corynebacterium lizhenjunii TaxID=2709394 RepID=A0A7T0PBZ9_9CORY|nr:restriction endonuclease subunit S [Corynebacterium lizhenjunii]QPK80010.1 restriction endonuclease subunit S [Corynebacterium lizhenjunii]
MTTTQHDWPMVKLVDVCDISIGKTPSRKNPAYWGSGHPWLSIKDMNQGSALSSTAEQITDLAVEETRPRLCDPGTVLFSFKLTIGKVGISKIPLYTNEAIAALLPKDRASLSNGYLFHAMSHYGANLEGSRAVMGQTLNKKTLGQVEFPLPPLEEQHRIAKILNGVAAVEAKVAAQKNVLAALLGPVLARASRGADKKRLEEIARVGTGATPSRKIPGNFTGTIPWVKTTEVNGRVITHTEEHISQEALQHSSCKLNRIGSSIVAMYGQGATRGRAGMLVIEAATNQACAVVSPHQQADDYYVFKCLVNSYEDLRGLGRGGTQPNLNLSLVKSFEIPFPRAADRSWATEILQCADSIDNQLDRTLKLMSELKNALATRAFQGEL